MRFHAIPAAFVLALVAGSGCANPGQPDNSGSPTPPVPVEGVRVTPQVMHLNAVGDTGRLTVVVTPASATDKVVLWESSNPAVASVDSTGLVTAIAAGAGVFITAVSHDGGVQSTANVGVGP